MASLQQRVAVMLWAALLGLLLAAPQPWAATSACAGASCASAAGQSENLEDTSILQVRSAGAAAVNKSNVDTAASQASWDGDPCVVEQCQALPPPEEPGKNTASGVMTVMGMAMKALLEPVPGSEFAIDAGAALLDGTKTSDSEWAVYQLQNSLVTMQDYLVCEMKKIMGRFPGQYMNSADLYHFNVGLQSVQQKWFAKCPARACLNLTDVPGDKRQALDSRCCDARPSESVTCRKANMSAIEGGRVLCTFTSPDYTGVCGTDRKCWGCVGRLEIIKFTRQTINSYVNKDYTSGGNTLDKFNNVDAIIAYAKGATFMFSLYHTLILLGAAGGVNEESTIFAENTVRWLEGKVTALRDEKARREIVEGASSFSQVENPPIETRGDRRRRRSSNTKQNANPNGDTCWNWQSPTSLPGYKVRYGCDAHSAVRYVRLGADDSEACSGCLNSDASKNAETDPNTCHYNAFGQEDYRSPSREYTGDVSNVGEMMNDKIASVILYHGCDGVQWFVDADYKEYGCPPLAHGAKDRERQWLYTCSGSMREYGYWTVGNSNFGSHSNEASSARVWTTGTVTNTETGCICQALQPHNAPHGYAGLDEQGHPDAMPDQYTGRDLITPDAPWVCTSQICQYTPQEGRQLNCAGWSKSSGSFTNYGRKVVSFDDAVVEATQKLDDFYVEQLKDVLELIDMMKNYIAVGGVPDVLWGVWTNVYPASDKCPVAQAATKP